MAVNVFDPAFDIPHPVNVFPPAFDLTGVLPPAVIERYFTELASAGSQYYTIPEIALSGDFEISVDFTASTPASNIALVSGSANSNNTVVIDLTGSGEIRAFAYAGAYLQPILSASSSGILDGVLRTAELQYTQSTNVVALIVDGNQVASGVWNLTGLENIDRIGRRGSFPVYYNGIIANVRIKDNGVLVRSYDIDETWVGPSTVLNDSSGNNQHGTAVNVTDADAQNYVFNGNVSPNTWTGEDATVIEVAGT